MEAESSLRDIERVPDDFMQHPYELLARFREEGPAHEVVFPHGAKVWLVTRYDEVRALVTDPRVSKDGRRMNEMFARHSGAPVQEDEPADVGYDDDLAAHMLNSDPPRHTRLRALVGKAFTARRMESLRPRIEQVVENLLDKMDSEAEVDLLEEFAAPLPLTIICDLFGIPQEDHAVFRMWANTLVGAGHEPEEVAQASKNVAEYSNALINAKRANPGEDMLSALVKVTDDGDRLTQDELVSMIFLLVVAGHVTTVFSIGNAVFNLLTHPAEMAKLRADPSLMPAAVDELMRFDGPSSVGTFRFTLADIPVGDVVIPAGEILALSWSSANHDSQRFPDGDRLDLNRRPVGALAFGHGLHYCIGKPLAMMQIEIALGRLMARYPDLRLAVEPDQVRWGHSSLLRGLDALPVSVTPVDRP
jgi:cytochrome P450